MATSLTIGPTTNAVGVATARITLDALLTFLGSAQARSYILNNPYSIGYVQALGLASGDTTITVPPGAGGVMIIPPEQNTHALVLKGAGADTGVPLARFAPTVIPFHSTPPANFVLNLATPVYNAQAVTADAGTDLITLASHNLVAGDRVTFGGTTLPGGLTSGVWYYVITPLTNTFGVSTTSGGTAVDLTSNGTAVTVTTPRLFNFVWF